jgi:hypothetical protein
MLKSENKINQVIHLKKTSVTLIDSPLQIIGDLPTKINFLNADYASDAVEKERNPG